MKMLLRKQEFVPCIPEEVLSPDNRKELLVPKCFVSRIPSHGIPESQNKIWINVGIEMS